MGIYKIPPVATEARRREIGVRGTIRACHLHVRNGAFYLTELRGRTQRVKRWDVLKTASVVGLAPTRLRWKDGPLELLFIHGLLSSGLRIVSFEFCTLPSQLCT